MGDKRLMLFDMDGVLFDTMPYHVRSWKQVADEYGLQVEMNEFYYFEGMRGVDTITKLYQLTFGQDPTPQLVDEIYQRKTELFNSNNLQINLIPYTREVMDLLQAKGLEIAVVTGSTQHNAYHRIAKHYAEYVNQQHIITAEDVKRGKPHPDPYKKGMELFGAKPEETIVIENAPLGVKSGHEAGALVIAVTTGPIEERVIREEGADLVFKDMKALLVWCRANL